MSNSLVPFHMEDDLDSKHDTIQFSLGNVGMQVRLQSGLVDNCLSVFVVPMMLSQDSDPNNPIWVKFKESIREFVLPLPPDEPLLHYAKRPFDHIQWSKGCVKLFWQREVLQISVIKLDNHYELTFKKLYWNGKDCDWKTGVRHTYSLNNHKYDYSLNLSKALTKEEYYKLVKDLNLQDESNYKRFLNKEMVKGKLNNMLGHIGLQLKNY